VAGRQNPRRQGIAASHAGGSMSERCSGSSQPVKTMSQIRTSPSLACSTCRSIGTTLWATRRLWPSDRRTARGRSARMISGPRAQPAKDSIAAVRLLECEIAIWPMSESGPRSREACTVARAMLARHQLGCRHRGRSASCIDRAASAPLEGRRAAIHITGRGSAGLGSYFACRLGGCR
jgi:hypothetical protein